MVKNTLKPIKLDTIRHPERIWNAPNRFGDDKLTVKRVLYQNNNLSTMSIITVDDALTSHPDAKVKKKI